MRSGRDFTSANQLTEKIRQLYGITRETNDIFSLAMYYKTITILADPNSTEVTVISIHEAAFLISDACWDDELSSTEPINRIVELASLIELPRYLVENQYSLWKEMTSLINGAIEQYAK